MKRKRPALFKGRHFEAEIIVFARAVVRAVTLSLRNLEEIMAERNLSVGPRHHLAVALRTRTAPPLPLGTEDHRAILASG